MMDQEQIFVGIDVSKKHLDVNIRPGDDFFRVSNDDLGIADLVQRLVDLNPQLILLEASGGYEILAAAALRQADLPAQIINPRQVREFARSTGELARPIRSTPVSWPILLNCCNRRYAPGRRPNSRNYPP